MKLHLDDTTYIDTNEPLDLSIPLVNSEENPTAWYVEAPKFEIVRTENYIGSVQEGGSVNFRNVFFNPHGHGTHTECLGHITKQVHSVNTVLSTYFFKAKLVSILPKRIVQKNGDIDFIITPDQLNLDTFEAEALIIRALPNDSSKMNRHYSTTNPPYLDVRCVSKLITAGVVHLLVDVPSVDRESDEGELAFHHAFWEVPSNPNFKRTITELIFVDNSIEDGDYILNIQMAPFQNDASPSRPILYLPKKK
ncbi:MAG: cyclase family protein [Crocinitomicaceae bacterium]|nr:cyclase family protein [Crocinitomicaceae bacterium]MDG1657167.1 cyclase family protein [Crocinitomicaceae bacterium]MDG2441324.1 cyclase family protein [Crocinitomicaceae bacterium]